MTLQNAMQERITALCKEQNLNPGDYSLESADPEVSAIETICDTFGITLADFFCCDTFRNIKPDVQ